MGLEREEFMIDVERAFEIELPEADAASLRTPRDLVGYLIQRLAGKKGTNAGSVRWSPDEIERVGQGLLLKVLDRSDVSLDMEFRELFP